MSRNHRQDYHRAWSQLASPARPHADVVEAMRRHIGPSPGRTLLLGVTPELADISADVVALDRNVAMVRHVWPGNSPSRHAVVGDWRAPPFVPGSFFACVGDCCLGALKFPDEYAVLFSELNRALQAGGRFVCRFFAPPDAPETVSAVGDAAKSGKIRGFHAFKFRLGIALAAQKPGFAIGVDEILEVFTQMFNDREELVRVTGWDRAHINTIDFYKGSMVHFHFPPRQTVLDVAAGIFSRAGLVPSGGYEMAELSPLLVAEVRAS